MWDHCALSPWVISGWLIYLISSLILNILTPVSSLFGRIIHTYLFNIRNCLDTYKQFDKSVIPIFKKYLHGESCDAQISLF